MVAITVTICLPPVPSLCPNIAPEKPHKDVVNSYRWEKRFQNVGKERKHQRICIYSNHAMASSLTFLFSNWIWKLGLKQKIGCCQQIISFILHVIGWVMLGPLGWVGCRRGKTRHFSKGSPRWGRDTQLDHPSALPECLQFEVAHPNVQVIWYGRT